MVWTRKLRPEILKKENQILESAIQYSYNFAKIVLIVLTHNFECGHNCKFECRCEHQCRNDDHIWSYLLEQINKRVGGRLTFANFLYVQNKYRGQLSHDNMLLIWIQISMLDGLMTEIREVIQLILRSKEILRYYRDESIIKKD